MRTLATALSDWYESYQKAEITRSVVQNMREPISCIVEYSKNPEVKDLACKLFTNSYYIADSTDDVEFSLKFLLTDGLIIREAYKSAGVTYDSLIRELQKEPDLAKTTIELGKI